MLLHKSRKKGSNRFYGWTPSRPDQRDVHFAASPRALAKLVPTMDLTNPVLPSPFNPCMNQGGQGSCGPHTAAECLMIDAELNEKVQIALPSCQQIYYAARLIMGTVGQDSGVDNRSLMKALNQYGWCDDTLDPYTDDPSQLAVPPSAAAVAQAATRKITQYQAVPQTQTQMEGCIGSSLPFIFGFTVYESFEGDGPSRTGVIPMPSRREQVMGGHDICFCGFTHVNQAGVTANNVWPAYTFKFRNHWYNPDGTPWGDGGFGYMPYAYALNPQLAKDFWAIIKSALNGAPTPPPPTPTTSRTVSIVVPSGGSITIDGKAA